MKTYLSILILAASLSGCAGFKVLEPQGGDRARLRGIGYRFHIDQNVCGNRPEFPKGLFLVDKKAVIPFDSYLDRSLGMPLGTGLSEKNWGEMYIQAGQPIEIIVSHEGHRIPSTWVACGMAIYFTPVKDRDYEAEFFMHERVKRCRVGVFDITNGIRIPVPISKEKPECN